jgi:uncharacterized protein (TIGR03000 family)
MYSAVLMLALTAGTETADFGRRGCNSCYSGCYTSCSVSYGCSSYGCSSYSYGCCGSRRGHRGHGCNSYCSGYYGCSGYGCSGYIGGCSGSYGCTGYYGCSGGMIVNPGPVAPKAMPKPGEKIEAPKKEAAVNAPATIIVNLPAAARLTVDGAATTSTSSVRTLVTPVLATGETYIYTMQAQFSGQTQTQQVTVRSGETSNVQFNFSTTGVASR